MPKDFSDLIEGGQSVTALARRVGTPLFLYDGDAIRDSVAELRRNIASIGCPWRIHYSMKANRHPGILRAIRAEGDVGIHARAPRDVALALDAGFIPEEISITADQAADRDLTQFARLGAHVNLGSVSAIRRYGRIASPGTRIGLRLAPTAPLLRGGFDEAALSVALEVAADAGLTVDSLQMSCDDVLKEAGGEAFESALAVLARTAREAHVRTVNVGGGPGIAGHHRGDALSTRAWAGALRRHLGQSGCTIACEPGALVVADAGILVVAANTIEHRRNAALVVVDAGLDSAIFTARHQSGLHVAAVGRSETADRRYTIVSGSGATIGILARDVALPEIHEGDLLALFPAGAHGEAMTGERLSRARPKEAMLT